MGTAVCAVTADMSREAQGLRCPIRAAPYGVMCQINTTPLIDVMLVLLVALIVSLPIVTHAVKLTLPQGQPRDREGAPEPIELEIDFDGTLVWNGNAVPGLDELERDFRAEARKVPQPEIHLRPDRRAKYQLVAKVLASAQHSGMRRIGFVNTGEYQDTSF